MTHRLVFWFLSLSCLSLLGGFQGWLAEAGTISGTGVTLGGLDNFAETVETYLKGNVGKMIGMLIAVAGIAMVVAQKMALGLSGLGAGIAIAFVPNIIGTAFDTTGGRARDPHRLVRALGLRQRRGGAVGAGGPGAALALGAGAQVRARPGSVDGPRPGRGAAPNHRVSAASTACRQCC